MRRCTILPLLLVLGLAVLCPTTCSAQLMNSAWPGFRHDTLHTGRSAYLGPNSPTLAWSRQLGVGTSSAAIGSDAIYVLAGGNLIALSFSGEQIWSYPCGSGSRSSPAISSSGVIYVASDSWLYAINSDGTLRWRKALPGTSDASPTVGPDGSVYIGCAAGKFQAYTSAGGLRYTYTAGRAISSSAALATDGTTYFGCDDGCLYALKADGTLKWKFTTSPVGAVQTSPAIGRDGVVYFGTSTGFFFAVNPSGTQKWRCGAGVSTSSPAIATDGTIYFGAQDSSLYALNKTGSIKWKHTVRGPVNSSPAIDSAGVVYFGSDDGSVYAVNPDGTRLWEYQCGAAVGSSTAIGDSRSLYVLVTDGTLRRLSADTTPPTTPIVTDDGAFSTSPSTLHASWTSADPESGISRYEYAIGTSPGAQDLIPFTDVGLSTDITRTDLALVSGARYYFSVRATNGAGLVSNVGVSDGITIDCTPPAVPVVTDDGKYSASPDTLHFVFGAVDPESGIAGYEYSIGTAPGLTDTLGWRNAGLVCEQTVSGLTLAQGATYFVNVRAHNNAGLMSQGCSDGILIDLTPPPAPGIEIVSATTTEVRACITASDPESGIARSQYAVLPSADPTNAQWTDCALATEIAIPVSSGQVYIAARALNGAGLWSVAAVRQVVIDTTPPTTPVVIDDGDYSSVTTSLHAVWSAQDSESGVSSYSYCLGTSAGLDDIVHWTLTTATTATPTGLRLTNGSRYFFSVKATNGVGLVSAVGSSDGIIIDTTPPTTPVVTDDGDYTSVTDSLHAAFLSSGPQSSVAEYSYCIGTTSGASDVVPWTSVGSTPSATAYGLSLTSGTRYYFGVKARNRAGLWSAVGVSDGIEFRSGASAWPKFHCDTANAGRSQINACLSGRLNWRVQTQGYVESSAAFAGDATVYIGSSDGRINAIASNGSVRWAYLTGATVDSSPAIGSRGEIYVGSFDHYLYCIDAGGRLTWKYSTGGMIWSSPVISADGTIYFGCQDGYVYALRPDGTLKWRYNAGSAVWSSPALAADGGIYFACGNGKLYALTSLGALKWTYQSGTAADSSPTVAPSGVIYFGSGDGYFYAINPNGSLKWRAYTGALVDSTAAIAADGTVFVGTGGAGYSGSMRAYSPEGVEQWRLSLSGGVRSSPAIDARGNIYFGTADGRVYCLRPDGTAIWIYTAGQSVLSSPSIGPDGQVVVGSDDGGVYCFKDYPLDTTPPSRPVVTPAQVFLPHGAPLACSWTATDPESGIESYTYGVGTQPGLADIVNWTNAGITTSMSRSDASLGIGQICYVSVKARNHAGLTSDAGVSGAITIVADTPGNLIGEAKKRPDGTRVYLPGKMVTAVFADCVFIEEPDRSSGIRCSISSSDLPVGAVVDAIGKISAQNGEVTLTEPSFTRLAAAGSLDAVFVSTKSIAGPGPNMTGLLVRVAGKVTKAGAYYFVLSDGSKLDSPRGVKGIEIRASSGDIPLVGQSVAITGVVSREVVNGVAATVIRAGSPSGLSIAP